MTLVPSYERKDKLKKYEEIPSKIQDLIRSTSITSDDYDERNMKIKFNSDDDLPLKKTLELYNIVVVKSIFSPCQCWQQILSANFLRFLFVKMS